MYINSNYCHACDFTQKSDATFFQKVKGRIKDITSRVATFITKEVKYFKECKKPEKKYLILWAVVIVAFSIMFFLLLASGSVLPGKTYHVIALWVCFVGVISVAIYINLDGYNKDKKNYNLQRFKDHHNIIKTIQKIKDKSICLKDKPLCLIVDAKKDHNGILKMNYEINKLEKKYTVIYHQSKSIIDLTEAIMILGLVKKVDLLWISSHGSENGFYLSDEFGGEVITWESKGVRLSFTEHLSVAFKNLKTDAKIVLAACSCAKDSFVEDFSKKYPDKTIIGASDSLNYKSTTLKIKNNRLMLSMNFKGNNVMRIYKNGMLQPIVSEVEC